MADPMMAQMAAIRERSINAPKRDRTRDFLLAAAMEQRRTEELAIHIANELRDTRAEIDIHAVPDDKKDIYTKGAW